MGQDVFKYRTLKFYEHEDYVLCKLYGIFEFKLDKDELLRYCDSYEIKDETLVVQNLKLDLGRLISYKIYNELVNSVNGRKSIYIDSNSGIPLVGSNSLGIVDRNTSLIEVKPITGCNANCIFCSVDEGPLCKNKIDFVIEEEYLIQELKNHIENYKKGIDLEIHLNCNGEPLLYSETLKLLEDMKKIPEIKKISLDTNAMMLTEDYILDLKKAGLDQLNISIHTLDKEKAKLLSGTKDYDLDKVIDMIHFAKKHTGLILAPVMIKGHNEQDIEDLVKFAAENKIRIGIQNYLHYSTGRVITRQLPWKKFYAKLKEWEDQYKIKLILCADDFGIIKTLPTPKPFKKGNVIEAQYVCLGHLPNHYFFKKDHRLISAERNKIPREKMKLKITRDKHNIFFGTILEK